MLRGFAGGLSIPQLAAQLFLGRGTIKTHTRHLYEKLGVSDRAAAVAIGMRRGLLDQPGAAAIAIALQTVRLRHGREPIDSDSLCEMNHGFFGSSARWAKGWVRAHDPTLAVSRRAVRAAVFVPLTVALGLATGNAQITTFAAIGAICLLLVVGFSGRELATLGHQLGLFAAGAVAIVIGTLCSEQPALAVVVMVLVGFVVSFAGILGPAAMQGASGVLVMFVAPVSLAVPAGQLWPRLLGLALATAVAIPVSTLFLPQPPGNRLRALLAKAADDLGDLAALHAGDDRAAAGPETVARAGRSLNELAAAYEKSAYLPIGVGRDEHATGQLVGYLIATGQQLLRGIAPAAGGAIAPAREAERDLYAVSARAFRYCAALLRSPSGDDPESAAEFDRVTDELARARERSGEAGLTRLREQAATASAETAGEHAAAGLVDTADLGIRSRALSRALLLVLESAAAVARIDRDGAGFPSRLLLYLRSAVARARPFLRPGTVWFRNSLRSALTLGLAVLFVELLDVPHGFWVMLGTIAALRSSASDTRASALRAAGGTAAGVAIASAVLWAIGENHPAAWALLPIAILIAGLASGAASFEAGQAAFSFTVLVLLRVLHPTEDFGLLRVDEVATGCVFAIGVSLLCWPRGAGAVLGRALAEVLRRIAEALRWDIHRLIDEPAPDAGPGVPDPPVGDPVMVRMMAAFGRLDDALRQYLSERRAKSLAGGEATELFASALRARVDVELLARLPPSPDDSARSAPSLPEVLAAGQELSAQCDAVAGFYRQIEEAARRPGAPVPALAPARPENRPSVAVALLAAVRAGRRDQEVGALGLAWASDALDDQGAIQRQALGAVSRLSGRGPRSPADPDAIGADPVPTPQH